METFGVNSVRVNLTPLQDSTEFCRLIEPLEKLPTLPMKPLEIPIRKIEIKPLDIKPLTYTKPKSPSKNHQRKIDNKIKDIVEHSPIKITPNQTNLLNSIKTYTLPETLVVAKKVNGPFQSKIPDFAFNHFSAGMCIPFMAYTIPTSFGTARQNAIPIRFTGMVDWSMVRGRTDIKGIIKDLNPSNYEGWKTIDDVKKKAGLVWYLPDIRLQVSLPLYWIKKAYNWSSPTKFVINYFAGSGKAFDKLMQADDYIHSKTGNLTSKLGSATDDVLYLSVTFKPSNLFVKWNEGCKDGCNVFNKSASIEIPISYFNHNAKYGVLGNNLPMERTSSPLMSSVSRQDRSYYSKSRWRNTFNDHTDNGARCSSSITLGISDVLEKPFSAIGFDNIVVSYLRYSPYAYKVASPMYNFKSKKIVWNSQDNVARPWAFVRFRGIDSALKELSSF